MANNLPIYTRLGDVSKDGVSGMNQLVTGAANDYTGVSTFNSLIFTADSVNGGFVQRIRFKAGATANTASVARIFINNGTTQTVAANNVFYGEVSLPATTPTATSATVEIDYPMNFALNPGFRIYFGLGTSATGGWVATVVGGKY